MTRHTRRWLPLGAVLAAGLAVSACGSTPAPPPDPYQPADTTVASVGGPANVILGDGRRVHIPGLNGSRPDGGCEMNADLALARKLIENKPVRVSRPVEKDTSTLVPAGYLEADLANSHGSYSAQFRDGRYENRQEMCPDPEPVTTTTSPAPSSSGGSGSVHVDVDRHHNMPDGALTGGFCRRRWWC